MGEKYGFDAWDSEEESLSDAEIADTINYANTITGIFGGNEPMDEWEEEHLRLVGKHQMTWAEYRPLHMKHVANKNGIILDDDTVDHLFERNRR